MSRMAWLRILLFLMISVALAIVPVIAAEQDTVDTMAQSGAEQEPEKAVPARQIRVFYFYYLPRCYACEVIEAQTRAAVMNNFKEELKSGAVTYEAFDIFEKKHKHYGDDYRLLTKSVIIAEFINGRQKRWKNCDRIWFLYEDSNKFEEYIIGEIRKYLK